MIFTQRIFSPDLAAEVATHLEIPVHRPDPQHDGNYEAYVASNVQYQASTDPAYQALLSQRQQLQDPDAEAAMVSPANFPKLTAGQCALDPLVSLDAWFL